MLVYLETKKQLRIQFITFLGRVVYLGQKKITNSIMILYKQSHRVSGLGIYQYKLYLPKRWANIIIRKLL